MSSSSNQEVVHEGWLTKSPPSKRIWRARWRRRWFALRHSGELPGQYFLEYYTDRNCRKLKGTIDLDQCEQVDAGLRYEQRKLKYQFMFDIKTPSRTYYLAAETEQDMNNWVECICQVCSLKVYSNDDQETSTGIPLTTAITNTTPEENTSYLTLTGPYIPISQCITGRPLSSPFCLQPNENFENDPVPPLTPIKHLVRKNSQTSSCNTSVDSRFYDSPRKHVPFPEALARPPESYTNVGPSSSPTLQSPTTDSESVFTDEEWSLPKSANISRSSRPSDSSLETEPTVLTASQKFTKLSLADTESQVIAPPRPPKPLHLTGEAPLHNYLNLDNSTPTIAQRRASRNEHLQNNTPNDPEATPTIIQEKPGPVVFDEMYDFPRSHHHSGAEPTTKDRTLPRHCYNNAAPVLVGGADGQFFRYDISPSATTDEPGSSDIHVFRYETATEDAADEPASPCSQSSCSTTAMYSNLPSPQLAPTNSATTSTPPAVNRGLKPGRGLSDAISVHSLNDAAPSVNRKLKPVLQPRIANPDCSENEEYGNIRKPRAAPSPIMHMGSSHEKAEQHKAMESPISPNFDILQYLELDLDAETHRGSLNSLQQPSSLSSSVTVYKTVDFVKTEAFNRTKKGVEAERKKHPTDT